MPTNMKESGLETLITDYLVSHSGYEQGDNKDYNYEYAIDEGRLFRFLESTQPDLLDTKIMKSTQERQKFVHYLSEQIAKDGVAEVLRKGIRYYPAGHIDTFYQAPSAGSEKQRARYNKNIWSVTRQLRCNGTERGPIADLVIFVNGIPIITIELKNSITHQRTEDAVKQYKYTRNPNVPIFSFKRCLAHFALDDQSVKFCTKLEGEHSVFLPFNKGNNGGAGNPPSSDKGIKTDYMWKDILTKEKLTRIISYYAKVIKKKNVERQIFPRYHQLDCVEKLITDVRAHGVGKRYLIQHSAGSGKSNSIAWLAYRLTDLRESDGRPTLDSVIVVTDRVLLDKQISDTIKQFMQERNTVVRANRAGGLRRAIEEGRRIIITTVQKFPFILDEISSGLKGRKFAIIIDEAHEGESGRNAAQMNMALAPKTDYADVEDRINEIVEKRRMLSNASYFAFTATPKNKTEEIFGTPCEGPNGKEFRPFHVYTMKQAIQEGFILDVLKNYTTYKCYYDIVKNTEDDPEYNSKRAMKRLHKLVESNPRTIAKKAEIIVDHFLHTVIGGRKIGGKARAMVVTADIQRCIEYFRAIKNHLAAGKSKYKCIIAFSGRHKDKATNSELTSEGLNGFSDSLITEKFKEDEYRILVVADMFQIGFDEPLLHTMYVDKPLSGIMAVQTLSRLNRPCPGKNDTFVLDFANDPGVIKDAFSKFYTTTMLEGESDPNKLNEHMSAMDKLQVYTQEDIEAFVKKFFSDAPREELDYLIDTCVQEGYLTLEEEEQVQFKRTARAFVRTYGYLSLIMDVSECSKQWEKLSIFLNYLIPKLPYPADDDPGTDIGEIVDLNRFRVEKKETAAIHAEEGKGILEPPTIGTKPPDNKKMKVSEMVAEFNDKNGCSDWTDADKVGRKLDALPEMVMRDPTYVNAMKNSDMENARKELEVVILNIILSDESPDIDLLKRYLDNRKFKEFVINTIFDLTYKAFPKTARL